MATFEGKKWREFYLAANASNTNSSTDTEEEFLDRIKNPGAGGANNTQYKAQYLAKCKNDPIDTPKEAEELNTPLPRPTPPI